MINYPFRKRRTLSSGIPSRYNRKTFEVSKKTLEFPEGSFSSHEAHLANAKLLIRNNFVNHVSLSPSQKPILFMPNSSFPSTVETKATENYYDNETIIISGLRSVPKREPKSISPHKVKKPLRFIIKTPNYSPHRVKPNRQTSVASSTIRFSMGSEDLESPSPQIQPRYKAFSQVVNFSG